MYPKQQFPTNEGWAPQAYKCFPESRLLDSQQLPPTSITYQHTYFLIGVDHLECFPVNVASLSKTQSTQEIEVLLMI